MKGTIIATALLTAFAGAAPAFAFADGTYTIRNASQTRLMCALRLERGHAFNRFTLDPGRAFRNRRESFGRERVLTCSSSLYRRAVFRIRAGLGYEVVETSSGALQLRTADGS